MKLSTALCLMIFCVAPVAFWFGLVARPTHVCPLRTIKQVQEAVGAKPDGIIGQETIRLWKLAVNQQYADEWNYYYEEKP